MQKHYGIGYEIVVEWHEVSHSRDREDEELDGNIVMVLQSTSVLLLSFPQQSMQYAPHYSMRFVWRVHMFCEGFEPIHPTTLNAVANRLWRLMMMGMGHRALEVVVVATLYPV